MHFLLVKYNNQTYFNKDIIYTSLYRIMYIGYTFSLCIEISYEVIETWAFIEHLRKRSFCLKAIFHDAKYTSRMKNTLVKGICHAMTLNNILVYNILEQITNAKSPTSQQNSL